jgi:putative ABC transport system permease protein
VYLTPDFVAAITAVPGIARVSTLRTTQVVLDAKAPAVALIARDIGDAANTFPMVGDVLLVPKGQTGIYVSEAMVDLYGARLGAVFVPFSKPFSAIAQQIRAQAAPDLVANKPASAASAEPQFYVAGIWRDYSRQFGAVAIDTADFVRLTGDTRISDLALWLQPGAKSGEVESAVRAAADRQAGAGALIEFASTAQIRAISLKIFDRSFAVTYWLQAVAIGIGLFGVAASFSAQVLARRKEFGLLVHLGLAVALVLVHVVNPQSFHWTMQLTLPWQRLLALGAAVVLAGTVTAWLSGRAAAGHDAVLAVKEDW